MPSFLEELRSTKVLVSGTTFVVLCYRRDVVIALFLVGAISNALLSKVLKRLINASRPHGARLSDPGMPSSHAQSLFFFAAFLAMTVQHCDWPFNCAPQLLQLIRYGTASGILVLATILTLLRVRGGLHTVAQVSVGAAIGSLCGTCWYLQQPELQASLSARLGREPEPAVLVTLLVVGALVVGSVERTLAQRLKQP
jgi:dolichyldiphosphatase